MGKRKISALGMFAIITAIALPINTLCHKSYAEGEPAAKATCQVSEIVLIDSTTQSDWTTLLSSGLRTANQKDLFIDASFESGLYTRTLVKSKSGTSDTSSAESAIRVRILVDGVQAYPGEVIFENRKQTLTAKLQGLLTDADGNTCLSADPDTGVITIDETCLLPEEIELVLDTMSANSFNFVMDNLTAGYHTIEVQAKIDTNTSVQEGEAEALATIGKGAVTIEEVRLVKDEDVTL